MTPSFSITHDENGITFSTDEGTLAVMTPDQAGAVARALERVAAGEAEGVAVTVKGEPLSVVRSENDVAFGYIREEDERLVRIVTPAEAFKLAQQIRNAAGISDTEK